MAPKAKTPLAAYTLDQAAEQLGVSRRTVNRLVTDGVLPVARLGHRTVRVRPEAINEALQTLEQRELGTDAGTRRRGEAHLTGASKGGRRKASSSLKRRKSSVR